MSAQLVFFCGFPSSGTDLLKNVVNAHSELSIAGEAPFLPDLAARWGDRIPRAQRDAFLAELLAGDVHGNLKNRDAELPEQDSYTAAELYWRLSRRGEARWKGNKTPQNTEHVPQLLKLFPEARFVLILRDIRDVALSWQNKWGKDLYLTAAKWNTRMLAGHAELSRLPPERWMLLTYESLLQDLEGQARRLCDFLELPFEQDMLSFHEQISHQYTGKLNYGKAILPDNQQKWRQQLGAAQVRRIEQIAWPALNQFGYPLAEATGPRPLTRIERLRGRARDAWATVAVGNRAVSKGRLRDTLRNLAFELRKRGRRQP